MHGGTKHPEEVNTESELKPCADELLKTALEGGLPADEPSFDYLLESLERRGQ